jgi:hypothetical protein
VQKNVDFRARLCCGFADEIIIGTSVEGLRGPKKREHFEVERKDWREPLPAGPTNA